MGGAEGEVGGGGVAIGGESCVAIFIEEAEGAGVKCFHYCLPSDSCCCVLCLGVPCRIMGVKVS